MSTAEHDSPIRSIRLLVEPHTLDAPEAARQLEVDPTTGLTADEAIRRVRVAGPNELVGAPPVPRWRRLVAQFADPLVYLLTAAVVIATIAWVIEGAHGLPLDAIVIVVIMVLNAVLGYAQEAKAEQAVAALQRMGAPMSTVLRDGTPIQVATRDLVVGDVLILAEGDVVGADARLIAAASLRVAEAALTGESVPVVKSTATIEGSAALGDRTNMVFTGTSVAQGTGQAVVTATAMDTQMGEIAELLRTTKEDPTPLQREMRRVSVMLGYAVIAVAVIVVAVILLTQGVRTLDEAVQVLLLAVSLAVAAIPEGLIAILSVVLALGVQRMAKHNAIVKKLSSVETLGAASVICSDKTGTLTRNEMTVRVVVTASGRSQMTGEGYVPLGELVDRAEHPQEPGPIRTEAMAVLAYGALVNDATLRQVDDEWVITGDPTEAAFVVAARKIAPAEPERSTRVAEIPFTSERKRMTVVLRDAEGHLRVAAKGAPDILLRRCTHRLVGEEIHELTEADRTAILGDVDGLSDQAYRTLGVAFRDLADEDLPGENVDEVADDLESGLVYAGTVGIIDPPRTEVAAAVAEAHRAGIRTVMITGDHPRTAARIAADLGMTNPGDTALTGDDLDQLDDEGLAEAVRTVSVFARVAPKHKLTIVDALQAQGNVVAMTGDGVNDAPALKTADIGVAMGITGTEVTKEAAKMVLTDDNFATIVAAVREGRGIFTNIRKFLRYLLSSNFGEVLTIFLGVLLAGALGFTGGSAGGIVIPLLATQILWINLLTDSAPALSMGVDPQTDDVMAATPRGRHDRVIDLRMWTSILIIGLAMALVTLIGMDLHLAGGLITDTSHLTAGGFEAQFTEARTVGFTVLVFAQLFNALACRSETTSAFVGFFANPLLWGSIALSVVLQVVVVNVPALNSAFGTVPLTFVQWMQCVALAAVVLVASEILKMVLRTRDRNRV